MQSLPTRFAGALLLEPAVHGDERGFFVETFRDSRLAELGVDLEWVQDNHSRSRQATVRGMHFQPGMAKLVRCSRGAIFDVVVDIRAGSPSFGRWDGYELNDENHRQLLCPDGFAHGFRVLSEVADVVYKCSDYWDPAREQGFSYADPAVGIEWPGEGAPIVSPRDQAAPALAELADSLPFRYAA